MGRILTPGRVFRVRTTDAVASGGSATFYESGTTTKKAIYTDLALSTQSANPVTLDSNGRLPNEVFGTGSYTVRVVDANGSLIWTEDDIFAEFDQNLYDRDGDEPQLNFYQDDQSTRNAYIDAGSDGILDIRNDLASGEIRFTTESSGGSAWTGLRMKKAGDLGDVDGTGAVTTKISFANGEKFWFEHTGNGDTGDLDQASVGLYLTANGMNTTSRHTPAIIFGSHDSAFTSESPKALAGIVGRAGESYAADTDGGMGMAFYVSNAAPGASPTLTQALNIAQTGAVVVGSPTGSSGNGAGTINAVGVYDDNSLLTDYVLDAYMDGSIDYEKYDESAHGEHKPARKFDFSDLDINQFIGKWQVSRKLPAFDDGKENHSLGETVQKLTETVEVMAIHIAKLNQRIEDLENA